MGRASAFVYRWTAFSFLVCAAFAWTLPFLDRAGSALLGFGFLALSVGRVWGAARPATSPTDELAAFSVPEGMEDMVADMQERIAGYGRQTPPEPST